MPQAQEHHQALLTRVRERSPTTLETAASVMTLGNFEQLPTAGFLVDLDHCHI